VIRQAISCDVCGTEKQHTNHWFVAYDMGGELRVSGWSSRNRLRAGAKHLCGQTCLHKLVDDFVAKTLSERVPPAAEAKTVVDQQTPRAKAARTDASLTSIAAYAAPAGPGAQAADAFTDEFESSARLTAPPESGARENEAVAVETRGYSSRNWRAEAWKREREREQRAAARQPASVDRRRFIA
jgi:hypothetical protein